MEDREIFDVNVREITPIFSPRELMMRLPSSPRTRDTVLAARRQIQQILDGKDPRPMAIVGPCSIHDTKAGLEYASRLAQLARRIQDRIFLVMRVYFEKPRTSIGWKGLIHDPHLNGSFDMATGLRIAREFLLQVNDMGLPAATEFVDTSTPQYIADLVSWAAIGARTAESQTHRQMASGLSMPVGFKNGTGGTIQLAVDAIVAAQYPHSFLGIDYEGRNSQVVTKGNPWGHLVLRGGARGPNYDAQSVAYAIDLLKKAGVRPNLIIDCSHGNSGKDHTKQPVVFRDVMQQRLAGNKHIVGIMLESHLFPGNQKLEGDPSKLKYGVSITDACIGWEETEALLTWAFQELGGRVEHPVAGG